MIYLASTSPRRQELLKQIGICFEVLQPDVLEQRDANEVPENYVIRMAEEKAHSALHLLSRNLQQTHPILAADTCIVLDGAVLGKPGDHGQAGEMLRQLSGRWHYVMTSFAIYFSGKMHTGLSVSEVCFSALSEREIIEYIAIGEGLDKAGAYAIQGAAATFISQIKGSYSGIVGLPLYEVSQKLKEMGLWEFARASER